MHTTPVSLLQRLRHAGEEETWTRFVELYTPLLYHWARHAGLQEQDAADLVQDVFTTLVRKMPGFVYDPRKGFRSWLRAVTFNQWRDNIKRRGKGALAIDGEALANLPSPDDPDPFWEAEYRNLLVGRALQVMRADFQPTTWRACWESIVNDKSAAQVAGELGISENSVYVAKCRVLRRLRKELEGLMD
jgi:RNA polymerase sigma-70 factor (ECF subfamily)